MGKQGAGELNYSSDIDLIVLYDAERNFLMPDVEPGQFFVRLTKRLVQLLQDMTEDGYAFRVDLRLRPDPRATQVAISMEAAAIYYENMGQNWERAAMIKARAAAGDMALGEEFLDRLKPYIWRKYLDFAAIADVQSLKLQIHAVKGHGAIAVRGHNLKLGRGGIREIEFFVQTQQLIAGGRNPKLRGRRTLDMLDQLAAAQWIDAAAADELKAAYRFLRTIEHRVQMVNDEQTHTLPSSAEAFDRLARLSGYDARRLRKAAARHIRMRARPLCGPVRASLTARHRRRAAWCSPAARMTPRPSKPCRAWASARPARFRRPSAAGISAAMPPPAAAGAKELLTELMPNLLIGTGWQPASR